MHLDDIIQWCLWLGVVLVTLFAAVQAQIMCQVNEENPAIDRLTHTLELDDDPYGRNKFMRVIMYSYGNRSCWAFVALNEGENKALGKWRAGDIFKAVSWKAPAKHARGNVFEDLPLCGIKKWTGPEYLI